MRLLTGSSKLRRAIAARLTTAAARLAPPPPPLESRVLRDSPGALIRLGGRWYPSGRLFDADRPGIAPDVESQEST